MTDTVCSVCGDDIPNGLGRCYRCGAPLPARSTLRRAASGRPTTVNLKTGLPTVAKALAVLDTRIDEARVRGVRLLRVIHGWGSSGTGGGIKAAIPKHLARLRRQRIIHDFVAGEHYSETTTEGRGLLARYPALKAELHNDRLNRGITFIEL